MLFSPGSCSGECRPLQVCCQQQTRGDQRQPLPQHRGGPRHQGEADREEGGEEEVRGAAVRRPGHPGHRRPVVQGGPGHQGRDHQQVLRGEEEVRGEGRRDHRPAPDRGHRDQRPGQLPAGGQERDRGDPVPDRDPAGGPGQDGGRRGHRRD